MSESHPLAQPLTLRRLRQDAHIRQLTQRVHLSPKQMIQPLFAVAGIAEKEPIKGLTGTYRDTETTLLNQIESDLNNGISKFLMFAVPNKKSTDHFNYDFAVKQIDAVKQRFGKDVWLATDVCLCSSTEHGHCGILNEAQDAVLNGPSTIVLAEQALAFAQAGADCIAPSDMMDGRIAAIREALNAHDLEHVLIMSYSAKFHSKFYGPFRAAANSSPSKGQAKIKDRASYQIDPGNFNDAFRSSSRDAAEGADILMVKPGLPYLDVLARLSDAIDLPWAVYQVSGEYAAIECAAQNDLIARIPAHIELWTSYKRAGADMIITYGARYAQEWLREAGY